MNPIVDCEVNPIHECLEYCKQERAELDRIIAILEPRCGTAQKAVEPKPYGAPAPVKPIKGVSAVKAEGKKVCKTCGKVRPLDRFAKHKECLDGHMGTCRECVNARTRARAEAKRKGNGKQPIAETASKGGYPCRDCGLVAGSVEALNRHVVRVHTPVRAENAIF